MTVSLDELNALPKSDAEDVFGSCCGASSWVNEMVSGRPYASVEQVLDAADKAWASSGPDDWHEAFSHHPRIGETRSAAEQTGLAEKLSHGEQSDARLASSGVHDQMVLINRVYEGKFGYIYVVSAAGKSGAELLKLARKRLKNDPDTELRIAAAEQAKITFLRLSKLLGYAQ